MPAAPYFYSRASREARRLMREKVSLGISTHAPLARRDLTFFLPSLPPLKFLLTRLSRGATFHAGGYRRGGGYFYSRASREARLNSNLKITHGGNFYSRASREARHFRFLCRPAIYKFLLTRLSRGATF